MGNNQQPIHSNFTSLNQQNFPTSKFLNKKSQSLENLKLIGTSTGLKIKNSPTTDEFLPEYCMGAFNVIRDFDVKEIIAKGAYGNVYKVIKKSNEKVVVLKVMQKSNIIQLSAQKRVKEEASIHTIVGNHPFIVKAFSFFQDFDNLNIVMAYMQNGDLFGIWNNCSQFSEELTRLYIAETALALDYLHKNGIIYRDIKMENILIDAYGHASLTDFGLSKWLTIGERTRTICGTLQYIAPEVLAMQAYTHTSDWWSLGVLMFSLLAGCFPLKPGKDHFETAQVCKNCKYELPFDIECSIDAKNALKKILEKDYRRRLHDIYSLQSLSFFKYMCFDNVYSKTIPAMDFLLKNCNLYAKVPINDILKIIPHKENSVAVTNKERLLDTSFVKGFDYDSTFTIDNNTYIWCSSIAQAKAAYV